MNDLFITGCSFWAFLDFVNAEALSDNFLGSSTSYPAIVAILGVSVITLAVICWALFFCTDCYNAEVDSTSHPACQSSGVGIAFPSQRNQNEGLDLTNQYLHSAPTQQPLHLHQYHTPASNVPSQHQYLHSAPTQQPLHLHQYHTPASNVPSQHQYFNMNRSSHCSNTCPEPSAPGTGQETQGYQNYQGYHSVHGYNHQSVMPPPPSYTNLS